jgi:gas vesicle protein
MASNSEKAALALVVGAAIGYAAGILTAPKSGKETREDLKDAGVMIKKSAEAKLAEAKEDLGKVIDEVTEKAQELSGRARKEADELLVKAKASQAKAKEVLNAVKSGESSDKDLQKAVLDAKDAKNHLVRFLKN